MFLFEYYVLGGYKRAVRKYEKDRKAWVEASEYRSEWDYDRFHAHPKEKITLVGRIIGITILVLAFGFFFFMMISESVDEEKKLQEKAYAGHSCKAHELNDRVKIEYGEYEGATGVIVGGCGHDEDYQVELDEQKFDVPSDGQEAIDVGGKIVGVDSYKNLTKIEKEKDAKS